MERISSEERLRELGLFSLEKGRPWGDVNLQLFNTSRGNKVVIKLGMHFLAGPAATDQEGLVFDPKTINLDLI